MIRLELPPVAGIPIVHEADFDLRFRSWLVHDWRGSRSTHEAVHVRHVIGDTSTGDARMVYDGRPWSQIYLDGDGRVLMHFKRIDTHLPEQLLVSLEPGYRYELRHREVPSESIPQMARDLPLLTLALPARHHGALVHACGFLIDGFGGVLCPGVSGAGKSTLARLLRESGAAAAGGSVTILSDDRVPLATHGTDRFSVWGSPWPGDALAASERDGPLRAIVFIGRGDKRALRRLGGADAAHRLYGVLGIPLWDKSLVESALELVEQVLCAVPTFEATYPPVADSARWLVDAIPSEVADA
jgi:hypothetical protein